MPRLLLFAPFDRAIVSQEDGLLSLIGLIRKLNVTLPPDAKSPLSTPRKWYIVFSLDKEPGDEGKAFEHRVQLFGPSDEEIFVGGGTFEFEPAISTIHHIVTADTLPANPAGEYSLRASVRESGEAGWRAVASFPLTIEHLALDPPEKTAVVLKSKVPAEIPE